MYFKLSICALFVPTRGVSQVVFEKHGSMDTYELADLMALSSAERATLNCVKVRGQTLATLVGLTTQLSARLCTKSCVF